MCRAARVVGVQSIVRPESDASYLITRYLDAGAGGVMVPHIETPEAARSVVEAVRYRRPDMTIPAKLMGDGARVYFGYPSSTSRASFSCLVKYSDPPTSGCKRFIRRL
jgi:hypothetical protein